MESLNKLFTEEQAIEVSEKILAKTKDKIKEQIANEFYDATEQFLYEIYDNNKDKIKKELISEITEQFVTEPSMYKFKDLRDKLWLEHKDEIVGAMTEEAIKENVERALLINTHKDYYFDWQWKDGIVKVILSNWSQFKDDERIANRFGREIERLKNQISQLQIRVNELSNQEDEI